MIREKIKKLIQETTGEREDKIRVERPEEKSFGDYSTNIALRLKKPAAEIIRKLEKADLFERIEVAGPGFINFFISKEYLRNQIREITEKGEKFGSLETGKGKKISLEFICANPTGETHIGHGRGAFVGDVLCRVFRRAGYKVVKDYYVNDAKSSLQIQELGKTALGEGTTYLTDYLGKKIEAIKPKLDKVEKASEAGFLLAREVQKDIRSFIEDKLKINFDNWVSENDLYDKKKTDNMFNFLGKKDLLYEKEGAFWLKTSEYGDVQDWVVKRKTGEFTYLLPDIAYHEERFLKKYDKIINVWGADHQGHVGKIKAVARMLGYKGNLEILISQVVRLRGEKMSKRKGKVVTLGWLVEEVGLDATRFFYLAKALDTHMEFDLDLAKQQSDKNPVYYVQYAHARICSIIRKFGSSESQKPNYNLLEHSSEFNLAKLLTRLPEIVEDTAKDCQIQRLPQYAMDLAAAFHKFYRDCRVISEDKELSRARLALVLAAKITLKNTLDLMGISAPEKM